MVSEDQFFKLHMGATLKSLDDLYEALKTMDDSSFSHHVNSQKNDFATWVEDVFSDEALSKKLADAKTRKNMINVLASELPKRELEKTEEELKKIHQKLEDIMWKEFSLEKKEDKVEKIEERIEKDMRNFFGMREFLFLIGGFSIGILFMLLMKALKLI